MAVVHGQDIYIVDSVGTLAPRLLHYGSYPAYAPDGETIAYASARAGGIFLLDADTGQVIRRITRGFDIQPSWRPDGKRLVFARHVVGAGYEIFAVNVDGSGLKRLTRNRVQDLDPAWSPDGHYIAIARTGSTRYARPHIVLSSTRGLKARTLALGAQPDFSPDSRFVAFTSYERTLNVIAVAGTGLDELGPGLQPAWSPDGLQIAFAHEGADPEERLDVYQTPRESYRPWRVTSMPPTAQPDWRP